MAERGSLLLAVAYLAAALHGLGAADIVGDDEAREAGIVQDVVAGHWLWPRFNETLLPDKPLLYHWLAAVPCAAAGFSETAVRLPSALAGAALIGWTGRFGTALLGAPAGMLAAALLATTPALFGHARVARPDVLLVLLLSAAFGLAFRWWSDGQRRDATGALVLLGAATLAKGPVAPVLFALVVVGFLAWQRDLRRLPGLCTMPGIAACAVLGLGWYAVALGGWGGLFVREHLVGRYLGNLAGGLVTGGTYSHRPLAYHLRFYLTLLPAIALPWTPFAAFTLWRAWRGSRLADPRLRFLVCWAMAPVIAFMPAQVKLRYYLLPSLPALALLAAPAVLELCRRERRPAGVRGLVAAAVVGLAIGFVAWVAAPGMEVLSRSDRSTLDALLPLVGGPAAGAIVLSIAATLLLAAVASRAWRAVVGMVCAGCAVWLLVGVPQLEQAISRRDSLKPFAAAVAAHVPAPAPLIFYAEPIRPLVVYLARPVPTSRVGERLPGGVAVIAAEPSYRRLVATGAVGPPLLATTGRTGNMARGRVVLVTSISDGASEPANGRADRADRSATGTSRRSPSH